MNKYDWRTSWLDTCGWLDDFFNHSCTALSTQNTAVDLQAVLQLMTCDVITHAVTSVKPCDVVTHTVIVSVRPCAIAT